VIWNPSPVPEPFEWPAGVNVLVVNEDEAFHLAKVQGNVRKAAEVLFNAHGARVVVTLGARGAHFYGGVDHVLVPAAPPPGPVVDTTGAGDCFTGALAVHLCSVRGQPTDKDFARALAYANRAAAFSVTRRGAMNSYPGATQVTSV